MESKRRPYILHLLRQYRAVIVLYFLIALISYPLFLLIQYLKMQADPNVFAYSMFAYWDYNRHAVLAGVLLALSIVTPYLMFSFLFNPSHLDRYFSLPVKREKLFLAHFLFGWLIEIVPVLFSHLLGFLIIRLLYPNLNIAAAGAAPEVYTFPAFLLNSLFLLLGSLLMMMPTTLAILFTPNLFNALLYGGVLHLLPILLQLTIDTMTGSYFGYTRLRDVEVSFKPLYIQKNYIQTFRNLNSLTRPLTTLIGFAAAVLLLIWAVWLFKRRRAERTNGNYMFKGFYPFLISFFGLLLLWTYIYEYYDVIFTAQWYRDSYIVLIFFLALLLYFIVQTIRCHGLPNIGKTILSYLGIFAAALLLSFATHQFSEHFIVRKMPDPGRTAAVEITSAADFPLATEDEEEFELPEEDLILNEYYYPFGVHSVQRRKMIRDKEEIAAVMAWQEDYLKNIARESGRDPFDYYNEKNIRLVYYAEDGAVLLARSYVVPEDAQRQELEEIAGEIFLDPGCGRRYAEAYWDGKYGEESMAPDPEQP